MESSRVANSRGALPPAFDVDLVVFENAYTNAPGEVYSRRSSTSTLACRAAGGQFGGSVTVTIANGGKIEKSGGDELPGVFGVAAGEEAELYTYFGGAEASGVPGDVVATAVFSDKMARTAYERQKGICTICRKHFAIEEMQADHIVPWSKGGHTVASNCQMLCADCNRRKGDR